MTVQLIVNYEGGGFGNAFGGGAVWKLECKFLYIIMNKETTSKEKLPTYEENLVVECLEERHEVEEVLQKQERMQQNELA